MSEREYDDRYKEFRKAVRARDGAKCQLCGAKRQIEVHHIQKWSSAQSLRYDPDNGICLCKKCHKDVTKKEVHYAKLFMEIVYVNTERHKRAKSVAVPKRRGRKPKNG